MAPRARHVLLFGLVGGALIAALQLAEYRYLVVEHAFELYALIVAAVFAGVGIWLGTTLVRRREVIREIEVHVEVPVPAQPTFVHVEVPAPAPPAFVRDEKKRAELGLTDRELEVLELIAEGLSTREMAQRLHVSENTIKTHASRVFQKLDARRRTQAVQLGKQHRLIP